MKALETLNPGAPANGAHYPATTRKLEPSRAIRLPGVDRVATGSPEQPPSPQLSDAAGRRPSPPLTPGRRPAGPPPLEASYRFDEPAGQTVVVLTRPDTQEVVRQMPPEKIVRLIANLRDMVSRILEQRA